MGGSQAASGGGSAPGTAASFLAQRFAVPHYPLGTPIGLRETDAFFQALEHLPEGKTPANHALERGRLVDAYVADTQFRKRDPRFTDVDRYKERSRRERRRRFGHNRRFTTEDFSFAADLSYCLCPAGKRLYRSGGNLVTKGLRSVRFKRAKSACLPCSLRSPCLRHPERTEIRQVAYFHGRTEKAKDCCIDRMKRKIDLTVGRALYAMRLAIAEPPFAHICRVMGLDRFTLRGKQKVTSQWQLFCVVHNLKKLHRYGEGFA